jgi:hypothetical protein
LSHNAIEIEVQGNPMYPGEEVIDRMIATGWVQHTQAGHHAEQQTIFIRGGEVLAVTVNIREPKQVIHVQRMTAK